jgi:N-acetylmuramoyl-L-alanine amidase
LFREIVTVLTAVLCMAYLYDRDEVTKIEQKFGSALGITYVADNIEYSDQDLKCLARNIYYEAGTESALGKLAVAHVTINRLKTKYWGNTICKVVYSPAQFSWTLKSHLPAPDPAKWYESMEIATNVLHGARVDGLGRSLFYHAVYIPTPQWAEPREVAGQIGQHVFYNRAKNSWLTL